MRRLCILLFSFLCAASSAAQQQPFAGTVTLPATMEAEHYDTGGAGHAWSDNSPGNAFGTYRFDDVDIGEIPEGGHHIGATVAGEWVEYTINVPVTGTYTLAWRYATTLQGSTFEVLLDSTRLTSQTAARTSATNWHAYEVRSVDVFLSAGSGKVLRVNFGSGAINLDWLRLAQQQPFVSTQLPAIVEAEHYDLGGPGVSHLDSTPGNTWGALRSDDVDLTTASEATVIAGVAPGEWVEYTVDIPAGGSYLFTYRYATMGQPVFRLLVDNASPVTFNPGPTGGWGSLVVSTATQLTLASGRHVLRLEFVSGGLNLDWLRFRVATCSPPVITIDKPALSIDPGTTARWVASVTTAPETTFQWYKGVPDAAQAVSGATSTTLELAAVEQARDAGSYFLTATSPCGSESSQLVTLRVPCNINRPDQMLENVNRALRKEGDYCIWEQYLERNFGDVISGLDPGYNKPVINAATAFIKDMPDWDDFWVRYLSGELGDRGSVWAYGGEELASFDYQKYNVSSVLAVHYHAQMTNQPVIRDLARRWLKATFALQAISAAPSLPATLHAKGLSQATTGSYSGPYVAMAGERSPWGFWEDPDRSILLASAVGWVGGNRNGESAPQRHIHAFLDGAWRGFTAPQPCSTGCNVSAYGLTATESAELQRAITEGQLPRSFVSRFLGTALRTYTDYEIAAWPGVRATVLRSSANMNTVPTVGVAVFQSPNLAGGNEAHFLYPWPGLWWFHPDNRAHRNACEAFAEFDFTGRRMIGYHPECSTDADADPELAEERVFIEKLPATRPLYHVRLSKSAPAIVSAAASAGSGFTVSCAARRCVFEAASCAGCGYSWSFGDGSAASGVSVTHDYATTGTFPVSLSVTGNGSTSTFTDTVSTSFFADVPIGSFGHAAIERIGQLGISAGCGDGNYCPGAGVTREQMAVFLIRTASGVAYQPPACTAPPFNDVPCSSPYASWIAELKLRGITAGCGNGNYCPADAVPREQMAVFLLRARHGSSFVPPACTAPVYSDVPCSNPYAAWINEVQRRGIDTSGCPSGGYCPADPLTRTQMALMLVSGFGL